MSTFANQIRYELHNITPEKLVTFAIFVGVFYVAFTLKI